MDEFIDGVQRGDIDKMNEYVDTIGNDPLSPAYVYSVRYALNTKDPEMLEYLLELAPPDHIFDPDTISASVHTGHIDFFIKMIGVDMNGLKSTFTVHNHPLVIASRIGNRDVVEFIVNWIRTTKARHLKNADAIKTMSLKMAARGGHVSIANLLITKQQHAHDVVAGLITNGHVERVKRFANHKLVDFTANNFELMRICAPYPKVLNYIMRHPSLTAIKDNMPTEYSRIAMMAAQDHFHDTVDMVEKSFKRRLTIHANEKVLTTNCSAKNAVAETYMNLNHHHKQHLKHSSLKKFPL
jgi:hypothetical protein